MSLRRLSELSVASQVMLAQSAAATAAAAAEKQAVLEGRSSVGADDERTTPTQHSSCLSQEHWKKLVHQVQQSRSTIDALTVENVSSSEDESDVETEDASSPHSHTKRQQHHREQVFVFAPNEK